MNEYRKVDDSKGYPKGTLKGTPSDPSSGAPKGPPKGTSKDGFSARVF